MKGSKVPCQRQDAMLHLQLVLCVTRAHGKVNLIYSCQRKACRQKLANANQSMAAPVADKGLDEPARTKDPEPWARGQTEVLENWLEAEGHSLRR